MKSIITFLIHCLAIAGVLSPTIAHSAQESVKPVNQCEQLLEDISRINWVDMDNDEALSAAMGKINNRTAPVTDCQTYITDNKEEATASFSIGSTYYDYQLDGWHLILSKLFPSMKSIELLIRYKDQEAQVKQLLLNTISMVQMSEEDAFNQVIFSSDETDFSGLAPLEMFLLRKSGSVYKKYPNATRLLLNVFKETPFRVREGVFVPAVDSIVDFYGNNGLTPGNSSGFKQVKAHIDRNNLMADF